MRSFKGLLFVLLALAVVFTFGAPAWAAFGSQGGATGSGGIVVDKDAPGTKYSGPLTIYYTDGENLKVNMHFFLRLRKGWDLYGFSGTEAGIEQSVQAFQGVINNFIKNTVIPILYPDDDPKPEFWFKAVDQIVEDNDAEFFGCCDGGDFTIMDVVISVQD